MNAQHLTEDGLKWLKIDIANTFGYDKATTTEQILWFEVNKEVLEALVDKAESPYEFENAVKAFRKHQRGEKVSHMMYIDCSNQALQLYGVLTADYDTAYICNLSSGKTRTDAYGMLAQQLNIEFTTNIFTRKNCKKALMTTLYGKRHAEMVIAEEMNTTVEALAIELNIDSSENPNWFSDTFEHAMNTIAPNAMSAMAKMQALNDENIDTYYWTMPDGFKVKYDVKRDVEFEGSRTSVNGTNFTFSTKTSVYGGTKYNAGMAPNIIHSIDGYVARQLIRSMGDKYITSIHDAFGVHPNDITELKHNYALIMIELLNSNILDDIMKQVANGRTYTVPTKSNTLTEKHILNSEYAIA